MQARKRRHSRTPFVVPTNSALYSAQAAPRLLLFWLFAPRDLRFLDRFSGTLKTGNLSRPEQLRLFSLDGEDL